jgi:hypothetical protein
VRLRLCAIVPLPRFPLGVSSSPLEAPALRGFLFSRALPRFIPLHHVCLAAVLLRARCVAVTILNGGHRTDQIDCSRIAVLRVPQLAFVADASDASAAIPTQIERTQM